MTALLARTHAPALAAARDAVAWSTVWAVAIVGLSYRLASDGHTAILYDTVFWLGMLPPLLLLAGKILTSRFGSWRSSDLVALAFLTWMPKLLRNPYGPVYHDEMAHYRSVLDVAGTGDIYPSNTLVPIIRDYPGLRVVTDVIHQGTGLAVWTSALIVIAVAHLLCCVAVYALGRTAFGLARAGAAAAFVYAANPDSLLFDNQFSYESLGIVLFVCCLALAFTAQRAPDRLARVTYTAGACASAVACVMTHHLSTVFLIAIETLVVATGVLARLARFRTRRRAAEPDRLGPAQPIVPWLVLWATTVGCAGVWLAVQASATVAYLSPYFGKALTQLESQASGSKSGRTLFSASVLPPYEKMLSFALPVLLGIVVLYALREFWRRRRGWHRHPTLVAFGLFGLLYFPACLFLFAPSGAEGARRSWGFSFIGLAVIAAALVATRPAPRHAMAPRPARRLLVGGAVAVAICVFQVGTVATGLNDAYRFPGKYGYGTDSRSTSPELLALARQFGARFGAQKVVTDRYTGLALVAYGKAYTALSSDGFPTWDLFLSAAPPPAKLIDDLRTSRYTYLIVDSRMSALIPAIGKYFEPSESFDATDPPLITAATLAHLDTVPWAAKVMQTDHYSVYRLDFQAVDR